MKKYPIDEIELEDGGEHASQEELLTGEVIKGLKPGKGIERNAEVEKNEYIQFPDGVTQKAVGNKHEKGGIDLSIPDGTKVVSDHLTVGASFAKKLQKEFGISVKAGDTYAKAIDKYTTKIGLKKLNEEQEELFRTLKKEMESTKDEGSMRMNREYLSEKISQVEQKKKGLEEQRAQFFNVVFDAQEQSKSAKGVSDEDTFKMGGVSEKNFEQVCKRYGLTKDQGKQILRNGGYVIPNYQDGDEHGDPEKPEFRFTYRTNPYQTEQRVKQSAKPSVGYGNVKSSQDALQQLYNNFPDLVTEIFGGKYIDVDKTGKVTFKGGIDLGKQQQIVLDLQKKMDERMTASASAIFNDESLPQEVRDQAKNWLDTQQFTGEVSKDQPEEIRVRSYDKMLGQFTAGRQLIEVDLFTPEDVKKLKAMGINTAKQVTPEILQTLSEESQKRYEAFKPKLASPNADFFIAEFNPKVEGKKGDEPAPASPPKSNVAEGTEIEDLVKQPAGRNYPRLFFTPDQSVLPPSAMEAHLKGDIRLERIDPVRIGIETQIQEIAEQRNFAAKQIDALPEAQRAAVLANLLASSSSGVDKAATQANMVNADAIQRAELFNIGQSGQEAQFGLNNALDYERRQLTAKAKTEEDLRRYYDFNRKVRLNDFQNQQRLNLMDSLFPSVNLDFMGASVSYDPNDQFALEDRRRLLELQSYMGGLGLPGDMTPPAT